MAKTPYAIALAQAVVAHLTHIDAKHHSLIRSAIKERLSREPLVQNRNRKPLRRPNALGDSLWEIRFGPDNRFRVFYDVDEGERTVEVVAIGEKIGSKVLILRKEVEL